ncbi:MAG: sigma-70 family RNA polymerase sigma factor [Isosphaeraceae bacterium]|nr:sigma-70 family RNA polymerase sigma factor [Isosphaeraceae bacterium]
MERRFSGFIPTLQIFRVRAAAAPIPGSGPDGSTSGSFEDRRQGDDRTAESATPEHLLALAKQGDGSALGRLLALYDNYLMLLARLQVGKRLQVKVEPRDLIQETFLEATRGFAHFQGETEREFIAWLRRIFAAVISNQVRKYFGTRRRDVRLERGLADDLDRSSMALDRRLIAQGSSPSRQVARREEAVRLANALEALPEDYREVIILRHLEDLSFAEVAQRMGRSEHSVKNLWARALARLRRRMDDPR